MMTSKCKLEKLIAIGKFQIETQGYHEDNANETYPMICWIKYQKLDIVMTQIIHIHTNHNVNIPYLTINQALRAINVLEYLIYVMT